MAMITGAHSLLYSSDPDATRAFFRDVLEFPYVDAGGNWLIFALPPSEVAVHPGEAGGSELYLMCDDIDKTIAELTAKGVEVDGGIVEERWGRLVSVRVPGAGTLGIYEPKHPIAPH